MAQAYRVSGMTCQGCVNAVTRAIQRRLPGAKVSVDLPKGLVTVDTGADHADDATVQTAVAGAGFSFNGRA